MTAIQLKHREQKKIVNFKLDQATIDKLDALAEHYQLSKVDVIRQLINLAHEGLE